MNPEGSYNGPYDDYCKQSQANTPEEIQSSSSSREIYREVYGDSINWNEGAPIPSDIKTYLKAIRKDETEIFHTMLNKTWNLSLFDIPLDDPEISGSICRTFWPILTKANLLHYAALYSAHACLEKLLQRNELSISSTTFEGITPFHVSAAMGDFEAIRILGNVSAFVTESDKAYRTPLHYAAQTNKHAIVALCAIDDSNVVAKDVNGETAQDMAEKYGNFEISEFLNEYVIDTEVIEDQPFEPKKKRRKWKRKKKKIENIVDAEIAITRSLHRWIPLNINSYLCTKPRTRFMIGMDEFCNCWETMTTHEEITNNTRINEILVKK